jgi:hypothetical protein
MFSVLVVQLRCSNVLAVQLSDIPWSDVKLDNLVYCSLYWPLGFLIFFSLAVQVSNLCFGRLFL